MPRKSAFGPDGRVEEPSRAFEDGLVRMGRPRSRKGRRLAKWTVYLSVFLVVAFAFGGFLQSKSNRDLQENLVTMTEEAYNPSFRVRFDSLGESVISAFYAGAPAPLDVARGVEWPSSSNPQAISPVDPSLVSSTISTSGIDTNPRLIVTGVAFIRGSQVEVPDDPSAYEERLTYYALVNGVPYNVSLNVRIASLDDYSATPVLMALPSLAPTDLLGESEVSAFPSTWTELELTEGAKERLGQWARSYTTDDRTNLRAATGDDSDSVYVGLPGGWLYVDNSFEVLWSRTAPDGRTLASVTWNITVPSTTISNGDGGTVRVSGQQQTQTMDLLLGDASSSLPSVLAWGGSGSYPDLTPGVNAISADSDVVLPAPVTPSATPEPTTPNSAPSSDSVPAEGSASTDGAAVDPAAPTTDSTGD